MMRLLMTIVSMVFLSTALHAEDFNSSMTRFDQNQQRIQTLVGRGTMKVEIFATSRLTPLKTMNSGLTLYLKSPDKVKISLLGETPFSMVQQGDYVTQRMPGSKTLITSKATNTTDLFNKYLSVGISKGASAVQILSSSTVTENGAVLQKYVAQSEPGAPGANAQAAQGTKIDRTEFYFDTNGMLVRLVSTYHGVMVTKTEYAYTKIGNVFATNQIQTTVVSAEAKIVTTISYTAVSVNTTVLDKEFDLNAE